MQKTGASRAVCGSAGGSAAGQWPLAFWLGIAAIAVRFETAGFANLGKADSIWPTVLAGPYGSWLFCCVLGRDGFILGIDRIKARHG